jgi:predicted esterase
MLDFVAGLGIADIAVFGPEAGGRSWWPVSFLAPAPALEPWLASALAAVDRTLEAVQNEGFDNARTLLVGFSQGGCLALEHAARRDAGLAGVFGLSAGLIGTGDADGEEAAELYGHGPKRFEYPGRRDGLQVHISCHERDPHIPLARVRHSARVLTAMGADVTLNVLPGEGHAPGEVDIAALRRALAQ